MARLLIVSRSMALAMRLADQHEVIEISVAELDTLIPALDADVLVLDVGDAVLAVNTVNALREADNPTPVMLVSGYQPEWEQVEAQEVEGVHVVPLPITRMALLSGIALLTGEEVTEPLEDSGPIERPVEVPIVAARPTDTGSIQQVPSEALRSVPAGSIRHVGGAGSYGLEPDEAGAEVAVEVEEAEFEPKDAEFEPKDAEFEPKDAVAETAEAPSELQTVAEPEDVLAEQSPEPENVAAPDDEPDDGEEPDEEPVPTATTPATAAPPEAVVTGSGVNGLSYADAVTLPFDEQPYEQEVHPSAPPQRPAAARLEPAAEPAPAPEQTPNTHWWLPDDGSADRGHPPAAPQGGTGRRLPRLGSRGRKLQRHPSTPQNGAAAATEAATLTPPPGIDLGRHDPYAPQHDPRTLTGSALESRLDAEAAALVAARPTDHGMVLHTSELVQMLHDRAGELYGVSDTAQVLADDVIERADADAAAVLVPDGPVWRVSGGVGLRPLERRLVLEDSHWLITEIGSAGRAVLIEDTDIIRQQLAGAPLAAWRHLLAVPVPDVRAIVVLARGGEGGPFADRELSAVIAPVREAAALLAQAVQIRRLARLLGPLREQEADSPTRRRPTEY